MTTETVMQQLAFKVALDPTPRQARAMGSHAGGARFAYNWGIARIAEALKQREAERQAGGEPTTPVPDHFALCKLWTQWKDTAEWVDRATGEVTRGVPWVAENFVGTYQAALRDAARAWANYFDSRTGQRAGRAIGKPRFKSKRTARKSFQVHGSSLRMVSAVKVNLPKIGTVTVMSDDSRHPAMARSRRRVPGQRHMGNRRRSRQLWQRLRHGQALAERAAEILSAAYADGNPDRVLEHLTALADERARARAVAAAEERLQKAKAAAAKAKPEKREKAQQRVAQAEEALRRAQAITANRKDGWSARKLAEVCRTGLITPVQAADLAEVFGLGEQQRAALAEAALQPRLVKATVTLGADGLWWLSLSAEVPVKVRTRPSRRQRERGATGLDLGVRNVVTSSKRLGGDQNLPNPRYLEQALVELRAAQKHLSRCVPGSARHARVKARVGLIHADVARLREQHHHRLSTRLAERFAAVAVEGYDLQELARRGSEGLPGEVRRRRNRALADTGAGMLRQQLQYKTARYGSHLVVAEPDAPTGRTCATCGQVKAKPVPPYHEVFACEACGRTRPRRLNTALALEAVAASSGSPHGGSDQPRGEDVRPAASRRGGQSSMKRAARSRSPGRGQTGTPGP